MRMRKYEAWLQTAKSGESIIYHEGYLAKDRFYGMILTMIKKRKSILNMLNQK